MKHIITTILIIVALTASAQDFKLARTTGRLELALGHVRVEGHSGNEIIFSGRTEQKDQDERARGLKEINSLGLDDNTGLGINVTENGNVITVRQIKKMNSPEIKILVPKGIIISYKYESQYAGKIEFANLENEIEVDAQYNSVELEGVDGPVTLKTIYGGVDATFGPAAKGPISLVSVYGHCDVTLPTSTRANLKLNTSYGEIYVAPELKLEVGKVNEMNDFGDRITGKLNGGGFAIDITSNYGKIYLRKK